MSVCVNIRTEKRFEPKEILKSLADRGEKIMVTSDEFPCVKFGTYQEALRGIEINKEDDGYEVRVCSFANRPDLDLFVTTIDTLMSMAEAKAYYENDDESEIKEPAAELDDKWKDEQLESSIRVNCILIKHYGSPVIMDGLFFPFCFGPNLANYYQINLSNPTIEDLEELQEYLSGLQWRFADKTDTSTRMILPDPADKDARPLSISLISAKDNKVSDFDYVSYADLLCLMNEDTNEMVMIPMKDFWKIVSFEYFVFLDDYQLAKKKDLTMDVFKELMEKAQLFHVDDLFFHPTYPGNGYDEKQKTFVLMWNPSISSVTMEDHNESIPHIMTEHFNWSVWDHEKAKKGDRFVMIRCGEGKTGLVMSGIFDSNPYQGEDWSGNGRKVFYMDMIPNFIANPEEAEIITTDELLAAIPSFDWRGGHSGRLLANEESMQLETLLTEYLKRMKDQIDGKTINGFSLPEENVF